MKKKICKIIIFIIILLIVLDINKNIFADVGSFESYDSDTSWDHDYRYDDYDDYGYDDYGYDDYSYSDSVSNNSIDLGMTELIFLIIFIIIFSIMKSSSKPRRRPIITNYSNTDNTTIQGNVEEEVKAIDELFNKEEFIAWVKDLFVKMQEAWSRRDWGEIRYFESNSLFEQHQKQLQGYIDNHQTNKMERICVKSAELSKFEQSGDKEILTVILNSKMIDYIIDDITQNIIKGDKITEIHSTYKMVFMRKKGVKTKAGTNVVNATNCPNCGAPTQITSSGKCDYCGSVVTTGEFNWVLTNLEKIG